MSRNNSVTNVCHHIRTSNISRGVAFQLCAHSTVNENGMQIEFFVYHASHMPACVCEWSERRRKKETDCVRSFFLDRLISRKLDQIHIDAHSQSINQSNDILKYRRVESILEGYGGQQTNTHIRCALLVVNLQFIRMYDTIQCFQCLVKVYCYYDDNLMFCWFLFHYLVMRARALRQKVNVVYLIDHLMK